MNVEFQSRRALVNTPTDTGILFRNRFVDPGIGRIGNAAKNSFRQYREARLPKITNPPQFLPQNPAQLIQNQIQNPVVVKDQKTQKTLDQKTFDQKTVVAIDSRDRDMSMYPDASDFRIFLGRSFFNIKRIQLLSTEIPNVESAIRSSNNTLYWINEEDRDLGYPVYSVSVNTGTYRIDTLQAALTNALNNVGVKRRNGAGIPHYFDITVNIDTDQVSFASLITQPCPTNPIRTTKGSGTIIVAQPNHGYTNYQRVHVIGVKGIVGGIPNTALNGNFTVTVDDLDQFRYEIGFAATETVTGRGPYVSTGREAGFKFLFGEYTDTIGDVLGFPTENSSVTIPFPNPLFTVSLEIQGIIPGTPTLIRCDGHPLRVNDTIKLYQVHLTPSIYDNDRNGVFQVVDVPDLDHFAINFVSSNVITFDGASIGTRIFGVTFPQHGFNRIVDIRSYGGHMAVTTLLNHQRSPGDTVNISRSNSEPSIDGTHVILATPSPDVMILSGTVNRTGYDGIFAADHRFVLYNANAFGGFTRGNLNGATFKIRDIVDEVTFTGTVTTGFSDGSSQQGGGGAVRIASKLHGFRGVQDNFVNGALYKSIALSGNNYAFLCSPQLGTMVNTGVVRDVFAKIQLNENPGAVIFNSFVSSPKTFTDKTFPRIDELGLSIRSPQNDYLSFRGLDYSLTLEIVEEVTLVAESNQNPRFHSSMSSGV
ncbi:hypothetical protein HK102_013886 [Quaeritorhiza haematococci]|nr:hypothetical protein HK102_013886 [Quaeritorhiza haematococci]